MSDMSAVITPKSDQWNYDDFQTGPMTFKIKSVNVKGGQDQPVDITVDGSPKFYRPCKSMARVLVAAWGADSSQYVGRSLTLYGDPKVKWGGMEVGGIRISHMSDIQDKMVMALTATRGSKKPYTVMPLTKAAPEMSERKMGEHNAVISAAQHKRLEARIKELGADRDKLKAYVLKEFGIAHLNELTKSAYEAVDKMLDKKAAQSSPAADETITRINACTALDALEVIADAFTEAEAVKYTAAYSKRKGELLDAAEGV